MWVWMDNSGEDIRTSTSKKRLMAAIMEDYTDPDGEPNELTWEDRGESIGLIRGENSFDEFGVIMKAKVVK